MIKSMNKGIFRLQMKYTWDDFYNLPSFTGGCCSGFGTGLVSVSGGGTGSDGRLEHISLSGILFGGVAEI